jgi:STE24 endopeptidase
MQRIFFVFLILFFSALLSSHLAFGAEFDFEAATRTYIDQLKGEELARSNSYFEGGYWLMLWGTIISVIVDAIFLKFHWSSKIRYFAERVIRWKWLQPAIYAVPYMLLSALITLPWVIYTKYIRENSYGFINQSFGAWFVEHFISLITGMIAMSIFLILVFAVIRRFPKNWWILATGITTALFFAFISLAPVFLAPLLNDYTEMEAGLLRDEIVAMAKAYDVPAEKIYIFNQSKQNDRISANVSGFGSTMRISLNDNLLNKGTPEEVKAVMGHELGHYVEGHVWRLILALSVLYGLGFFIISRLVPMLTERYGNNWGVRGVSDIASLPLYSIILGLYFLAITPISNSLIRINENQADIFGLEVAQEPDAFASIAMKLSEYRKIEPTRLEEIIFFDHPSGKTRVELAMKWKAAQLEND